jgi:hypothetical protein
MRLQLSQVECPAALGVTELAWRRYCLAVELFDEDLFAVECFAACFLWCFRCLFVLDFDVPLLWVVCCWLPCTVAGVVWLEVDEVA